ncbi:hypothetical protein C3L33_22263, partial [Rhododendron williamsianum]
MGVMDEGLTQALIPLAALVGIGFALFQWFLVSRVKVSGWHGLDNGYKDKLIEDAVEPEEGLDSDEAIAKCAEIQNAISVGATSFLFTEYKYLGIFTLAFGAIIFLFLGSVNGFSTKSQPCTYNVGNQCKPALANAFFTTVAFLLGSLTSVIADNVGDNVGDIAGMGSDLFGSYAESSCAALFVASISSIGISHDYSAMSYPLLISSMGIVVCLITTLFATDFFKIKNVTDIEPTLKRQLVISTILMTAGIAMVSFLALPSEFTLYNFGTEKAVKNWHLFFCVSIGLWAGLVIGYTTEYYTSNAYSPVRDVADSCRTGAATNVIFGLALGYKSVIIPIFAIAVAIYVSFSLAAMYGIAVAALGMLSTIATGLAIDAYGPISDNAGGIAEMAGMSHKIRKITDALDAAGNTTAAIGKGFAIGSAALVSLALFGAFVSRAGINSVDVLTPKVFIGLLVGAMLPYWFSAMTMKSVGSAALKMVEEVRRQFNDIPGLMEGTAKPDYASCVKISTDASLKAMIPPGALVMLTPLIAGTFFGVETLAGVLAGSLVSGVQVAISASNTGGAWDNAKKYIEAGATEHARTLGPKGSDAHKAAVIGDTVGDPLKDTSGPSLNILIKLMAVESLVFAPFFAAHGGLLFKLF